MEQVRYSQTVAACWMILGLTACGQAAPIATFTHDLGHNQRIFGRQQTLYAYAPEPGASTGPAGMAHSNDVGRRHWPKSAYNCIWRNASQMKVGANADTAPPDKIILACQFGTSDFPAWSPGTDHMKYAAEARKRDQATFRMDWHRQGHIYVMDMLQVMIERHDVGHSFTSHWSRDEIAKLNINQQDIQFTRSPSDAITFKMALSLAQHQYPGATETVPKVTFSVAGKATAMPDWMFF